LAKFSTQAQRMRQPGQAQTCGQTAQHGAPGTTRCSRWRCRRCGCRGRVGRGSGGRIWRSVWGRCGASRFALGHIARLLADGSATAQTFCGIGVNAGQHHEQSKNNLYELHLRTAFTKHNHTSTAYSNMQCHHTQAQVVYIHMGKAILLHQGFETLLVRVHADGLGQVAVTGVVTRHHFSQPRQNFK
jgi:hypothetical protein